MGAIPAARLDVSQLPAPLPHSLSTLPATVTSPAVPASATSVASHSASSLSVKHRAAVTSPSQYKKQANVLEGLLSGRPARNELESRKILKTRTRTKGKFAMLSDFLGSRPKKEELEQKQIIREKEPLCMQYCEGFLARLRELDATHVEGIFRISGDTRAKMEIIGNLALGHFHLAEYDVHDVTSAFKMYLREVPVPVVPFDLHDRFVALAGQTLEQMDAVSQESQKQQNGERQQQSDKKQGTGESDKGGKRGTSSKGGKSGKKLQRGGSGAGSTRSFFRELAQLFLCLPPTHKYALQLLFDFLVEVADNQETNLMSEENLGELSVFHVYVCVGVCVWCVLLFFFSFF
jgi:RhoGAP domain